MKERDEIRELMENNLKETVEYLLENQDEYLRFLEERHLKEIIRKYLYSLDISVNTKGCYFLQEIIFRVVKDGKSVKSTYSTIAYENDESYTSFSKSINYVIRNAKLHNLEKYGITLPKDHLTIMRFISISVDVVKNLVAKDVVSKDNAIKEKTLSDEEILAKATQYLQKMGISRNLVGFDHLRQAVLIGVKSEDFILVTKDIYPYIAQKYGKNEKAVERNIRTAIESGFNRANPEDITKIFGETYSPEKGKTTNSEFISMLIDKIKHE